MKIKADSQQHRNNVSKSSTETATFENSPHAVCLKWGPSKEKRKKTKNTLIGKP